MTDNQQLMTALGFTAEDLAQNRAGQMSEIQRYNLSVRRQRAVVTGIVILLLVTFVATFLIFIGGRQDSPILTVIGIGVTILNAVLAGIFARYWFRLSADISSGTAQAASGTLERVIKPVNRRVMNYVIRVGEAEVFIPREVFDVFAHRTPYTIYRTPHTGTLLSAERGDT
jgi:hypothetical protein